MPTFFQGIIVGQILLSTFLLLLIKLFLFRNTTQTVEIQQKPKKLIEPTPPPKPSILLKTQYDPLSTNAESCAWLNVLLAQVISKYRGDIGFINKVVGLLDTMVNGENKPDFIGTISFTEFSLGQEFPLLKDASIRYSNGDNLRAQVNFEFNDQITLGIDTQILVNWPKPCFAALPVSLVLSVIKFSGTCAIEFLSNPTETPISFISLSLLPDFKLEFQCKSTLGHATKVNNLPKLEELIVGRLKGMFAKHIVEPNAKLFAIPVFWGDAQEEVDKNHDDELESDTSDDDAFNLDNEQEEFVR